MANKWGWGNVDDYLSTPHIRSLVSDTQPAPNAAAAAGITGTIHGIMSSPLSQDTSKYDGSAPITQSQSNALPWWQQTHTIIPDAAIPPAEADPAYVNRLKGTMPLAGVSMSPLQGPVDLSPQWLKNWADQ